jgi:flagellar L-ring protein precursor FlgH
VFSDFKARHVNDLITINIAEKTTATSKADTTTTRNGSNKMNSAGLIEGLDDRATTTASKYKGNGNTDRSVAFSTRISARVVRVLQNENLIFEGFRDIQLNNETQRIYVAGIVDPSHLDASSSVSSDQIAELRLGYGGKGVVDETLKPGYISRILNLTWPF